MRRHYRRLFERQVRFDQVVSERCPFERDAYVVEMAEKVPALVQMEMRLAAAYEARVTMGVRACGYLNETLQAANARYGELYFKPQKVEAFCAQAEQQYDLLYVRLLAARKKVQREFAWSSRRLEIEAKVAQLRVAFGMRISLERLDAMVALS